ncbi:MAG: thioredoxin family protein [PS1 clade bacterium]|jgi:thioredoxin-related protein
MKRTLLILSLLFSLVTFASEELKKGEFLGAKTVEVFPDWFKTSFLDFNDDIKEANEENRHVMIYFWQNGCPYCSNLVEENFHNDSLVLKLNNNFDVIEINMWGDRELVDWNGTDFIEKEFSEYMSVQFTPTLVFLNSNGDIVLRMNGYQSVKKMHHILDYVSQKIYSENSFASYINSLNDNTTGQLNDNPIFENGPHMLSRSSALPAQKYLAVFFEQPNCSECDTFHNTLMKLDKTKEMLSQMQVVRFNAVSSEKLLTTDGKRTTASEWYDELKLTYKPAIVFFDKEGVEIIRKDAMFKEYHLHGIFSYVLSSAYIEQPNFQRYLEDKSDKLRDQGITVDIWK